MKPRLIRDRGGCAVEFRDGGGKLLVVGGSAILKDAKCDSLAKKYGLVRIAAVMDSSVDSMTEADVVAKLAEFAVYR